ncbi:MULTISPECIES: DUF6233 domain-containing protein [unclassified Streptomyces]|uniref:DUF6233 domain-containing protein n=1 Tax=unclassified Streptomyces TaxID=2593676 RepID=UPI0033347A91
MVRYLRNELARAERAVAAAEEQEAAAVRRRPPARPAEWLIERGIGVGRLPVRVHVGGCWDTRKRCAPVGVEEARRALAEGASEYPHCLTPSTWATSC